MIGGPRGLLEQEVSKPRSVGRTLGRLASYFKPFWLALVGVLLLMVVNAWVQVITPELLGQAVDCYLTPAVTGELHRAEVADGMPAGVDKPQDARSFACWFGTLPRTCAGLMYQA